MKPDERRTFLETQLGAFLGSAKEGGYITIEVAGAPDEYVQYQFREGRTLYGEVGARQWRDPERPLSAESVAALAALGFSGGGPERNHARPSLPCDTVELAQLTEQLFDAAYGVDDQFAVVVQVNVNDVVLPRAVPFTRSLIREELEKRGLNYLRDGDGDFCVQVACPGYEEEVTFWFLAEGSEDGVYRISATAPRRPGPETRWEALELCNRWNAALQWPTAAVTSDGDDWHVIVYGKLNLRPGVTPRLLSNYTDDIVMAALEFLEWLATTATAEHPATNDETA